MSGQVTDRVLSSYRIGDPAGRFPIYSAKGAELFPGRWNTPASPVIYTSEHYSTAMLEKLAHANGLLPANQHFIVVTIPNGVSYEVVTEASLPGWADRNEVVAKDFGHRWFVERRSALLLVPSLPARIERNVIINPEHPDAAGITHSLHEPVWWDERLFRV